ncbi:MAG: serine/threonine-protein kinase, partial [Pirellulales bacterium]
LRELWAAALFADAIASSRDLFGSGGEEAAYRALEGQGGSVFQLPRTFGDYELQEELGRGGMGVVYRAHQTSLDRTVALKMILRGQFATADDQARFKAEAEAAARLDHPHIVPVYEVGEYQGHNYFSMKYVAGETLSGRLAEGPLPAREAARLLATVARAIDAAHVHGVLHRDLKPSNILIDRQGEPHVTDFGLAKRVAAGEQLTRTGAILGTPTYMAPEQAAGSRGKMGPTTDVYSLGTILYQMLTGRPPFQAATPLDTVMLVLEQDPLPPRMLNPKADRELELIAMRCLQKPPELRYQSAAALAGDLELYLAGEPISARSGRFSAIVGRWFRETHHVSVLENWGLLWIWHSIALLVLCLVTNWLHFRRHEWPVFEQPWPYLLLWGGGLAIWAPIFWALRRRAGPVTFVERQVAHVWGGSVIASVSLFAVEMILILPVLTLSPVLGLINGMVFTAKASILSGEFYFHATALFVTAIAMALLQAAGIDLGLTLFGVVSALCFMVPGVKYYRRSIATQRDAADE